MTDKYEMKATFSTDEDDKCDKPEHEFYTRGYTLYCEHCEFYFDFDGLDFTITKVANE